MRTFRHPDRRMPKAYMLWPWLPLRWHFSPAQGWPTQRAVMIKVCCVCAVQYGIAQGRYPALEIWWMGLRNQGFSSVVLMAWMLNVDRHTWLLVVVLSGTALTCSFLWSSSNIPRIFLAPSIFACCFLCLEGSSPWCGPHFLLASAQRPPAQGAIPESPYLK